MSTTATVPPLNQAAFTLASLIRRLPQHVRDAIEQVAIAKSFFRAAPCFSRFCVSLSRFQAHCSGIDPKWCALSRWTAQQLAEADKVLPVLTAGLEEQGIGSEAAHLLRTLHDIISLRRSGNEFVNKSEREKLETLQ